MVLRPALKQPEKNAQRNLGEKRWTCYFCGKEGHLKWDCPQASKPPPAPGPACKGSYWRSDCSLRCRPQGADSQDNQDWRYPGVPTQALVLITPEETQVLITVDFFRTLGHISPCSLKPLVSFPPAHYHTMAVWMSQRLLYQSSCKLQLGLCAVFSNPAGVSLTPSGEGYTEQGPGLYFHKYGTHFLMNKL